MAVTIFNAGLAWSQYKQIRAAYCIAAAVAFLMSSYFVVGYLAGSLEVWRWGVSEWLNALAGFGITGVMTAYQFFLYAQGDIAGGSKATILAICVAVGFSLLSEVGQGMERDHLRMELKSQQSPTYQALLGQLGQSGQATQHPYSFRLADAETKLARCRERVATGQWKDCVESEARLKSVQGQINHYYQQQTTQRLALTDKAKALEKDESNYHPLVNLVRSSLGASGAFASFIVSFVLISFFEYAFHYLGGRLAAARLVLFNAGYDVTHKIRKRPTLLHRTDTPANGDTAPHTDNTQDHTDTINSRVTDNMQALYETAKQAKAGQVIQCPNCQTAFTKKTYNQCFCKKGCKDNYWNLVKPERLKAVRGA